MNNEYTVFCIIPTDLRAKSIMGLNWIIVCRLKLQTIIHLYCCCPVKLSQWSQTHFPTCLLTVHVVCVLNTLWLNQKIQSKCGMLRETLLQNETWLMKHSQCKIMRRIGHAKLYCFCALWMCIWIDFICISISKLSLVHVVFIRESVYIVLQ